MRTDSQLAQLTELHDWFCDRWLTRLDYQNRCQLVQSCRKSFATFRFGQIA